MRAEELLAYELFDRRTRLRFGSWVPVQVVDFQMPLKAARSDWLGKVDLLGVGEGLTVIELKVLNRSGASDTPLNALVEAVGYAAVVEKNAERIRADLEARGRPAADGATSVLVLATPG